MSTQITGQSWAILSNDNFTVDEFAMPTPP